MKKTLILTGIVALSLAGCGATNDAPTQAVQQVPAPTTQSQNVPTTSQNGAPEAANLDAQAKLTDGDLYIKALSTRDPRVCSSIQDESLKSMCATEAAKK